MIMRKFSSEQREELLRLLKVRFEKKSNFFTLFQII
jgi:hypothetical protein